MSEDRTMSNEYEERREAVCKFCQQRIYLAGDEWRHSVNESVWCPRKTAEPATTHTRQSLKDLHDEDCLYRTHNGRCDCLQGSMMEPVATRMREACVEEAKKIVAGWRSDLDESWDERPDLSFEAADKIAGANEIIAALQSLTLDNVEQEKR